MQCLIFQMHGKKKCKLSKWGGGGGGSEFIGNQGVQLENLHWFGWS